MEFALSTEQSELHAAVRETVDRFGDAYWLELDRTGIFPDAFYQTIIDGGFWDRHAGGHGRIGIGFK